MFGGTELPANTCARISTAPVTLHGSSFRVTFAQLRNVVYEQSFAVLGELGKQLDRLKRCSGAKECTLKQSAGERAAAADVARGEDGEEDPGREPLAATLAPRQRQFNYGKN